MTKRDWRLAIGLLLIYLMVSFIYLGNTHAPQTFWKSNTYNESVIVDLGETHTIARMNILGGAGMGKYTLQTSLDNQAWTTYKAVNHDHVFAFAWTVIQPSADTQARYVRLDVTETGASIMEMGIFDEQQRLIKVKSISNKAFKPLFDEQRFVPWAKTTMNSSYFDEIYHARTAFEFLHHLEPYETTHPPLGKDIQAIGIWLFGMTPFGWRFMGTLAGALMIPIMFVFAKTVLQQTRWAIIASLFVMFDLMHFTQSRMGTVDTYIVVFVMLAYLFMVKHLQNGTIAMLALSGLFYGCASAVKWSGVYAGFGLALLFFMGLYKRYRESKNGRMLGLHIGSGFVFYALVPILIYVASYIPYLHATAAIDGFKTIWTYQKDMYDYHSNLTATHPFASKWNEWPLIKRPLWLYSGADLAMGKLSTLVVLGNPILWWSGLVSFSWGMLQGWRRKEVFYVLVALLSLYLPWILAPRDLTFIYHFFPMTPFWFLLLAMYLKHLTERSEKVGKTVTTGIIVAAFIVFLIFYPAITAIQIDRSYAEAMWKWIPTWQFF